VLAAAADLTDPARVAESFTGELEEQVRPVLHRTQCMSAATQYDCREFFDFLYTLDAEIVTTARTRLEKPSRVMRQS